MRRVLEASRRAIAGLIRRTGYDIRPASTGPISMEGALAHFARRFPASTVVDVGASNGCWTEIARRYWPDAAYLLIEAQQAPHEAALKALKLRTPRLDYVLAAAGGRIGSIHFDASDPFGGRASDTPTGGHDVEVPVTTIDHEVGRRGLDGPFLVKLDTHGFEVDILSGATAVLRQTSLLVVEVYNFTLADGALRFPEFCDHVEQLGFRPIGIVDLMYRPRDGALWQFDCFFARTERPEFGSNTYQ
jgi:FkbM family methyltransferase